ncbi:MAG: ParA family protein [Streptomycetaceae bacterium]|nr:MAG: ParA family protein [Streptomycetaceae bacterium]
MSVKSTFDSDVATTATLLKRKPKEWPIPAPLSDHGNATIIPIVNQKGGVGKTTTTINLGAALAELGRRVLLVDFDPQGALSVGLGVNAHELRLEETVYQVLMDPQSDIEKIILKTSVPGMDLLPANKELATAEVTLVNEMGRENFLKRTLESVKDYYDVILIDCQPTLGLLTLNALTAADGVIVPLQCEFFALRGFAQLQENLEKVRLNLNPNLKLIGILATMYDKKTLHSREVLERILEAFPESVFETVIAQTVRFPETTVAGEPITTYAGSSGGAASYRRLARELIAIGGTR